jgi:hypothetical protein
MGAPIPTIWTIGHSNLSFEDFVLLLTGQNINKWPTFGDFPAPVGTRSLTGNSYPQHWRKEESNMFAFPNWAGDVGRDLIHPIQSGETRHSVGMPIT